MYRFLEKITPHIYQKMHAAKQGGGYSCAIEVALLVCPWHVIRGVGEVIVAVQTS